MSAAWTSSALAQLRRAVYMECTLGYFTTRKFNISIMFTTSEQKVGYSLPTDVISANNINHKNLSYFESLYELYIV